MSKAKKRLKNFDFSGENHAVALVHEMQGGAANGSKTLIMKAADVTVELTMAEFLNKFFGLWYGDAQFLARMFGYSDEMKSSYEDDYLEGKVTLMKSFRGEFLKNQNIELPEEVIEVIAKLAEKSNIKITDLVVEKNASGVSEPVSENKETPNEVDDPMSEKIDKSVVEQMIAEEIQKAAQAAQEKDSQIEELQKSLKALEDEKVEVRKAQFIEKAKEYEVLGVEDFESFGVALMKMSGDKSMEAVIATLEKAVNIAKNVNEFNEEGHDVDVESESDVTAVLKARNLIK